MKQILFSLIIIGFTGCLRLDSNLYNSDNTIYEYEWDDYSGEVDFRLDSYYDILPGKRHLLTLDSKGANDIIPVEIKALYLGDINRISTDTVIMYCHGNRDHMDFYWQRAKLLANTGSKHQYGVMMCDYRGFGLSKGEATEEGLYADVDACLKWLKNNGLTEDRLIIYGFSLGSAPATELIANPRTLTPSKIILENPFASAAVMVADASVLNLPASYFTNLEIDNAEEIKKVDSPFLWMHGRDDDFLNINTHGEVVYGSHPDENVKFAHRITGANHGNLPQVMGYTNYLTAIKDFIQL